jgi:hypothetical protein
VWAGLCAHDSGLITDDHWRLSMTNQILSQKNFFVVEELEINGFKYSLLSKIGMPLDMIGRKFGRLTVIGLAERDQWRDKNR